MSKVVQDHQSVFCWRSNVFPSPPTGGIEENLLLDGAINARSVFSFYLKVVIQIMTNHCWIAITISGRVLILRQRIFSSLSVGRINKDDVKSGTRSSYVSLNPKRFVPLPLRRLYLKSVPSESRFCWRKSVFASPLTGGSYSDYDKPLLDCHYNLRQRFDPETTHLILSHSILLQYVHARWPWSRPTKHQLPYASAIHSVVVIAVTGPVDVRCVCSEWSWQMASDHHLYFSLP
ncbi:hypothetical protein T10_12117 [Trichinella papuae]|uniref:Uncharacterized protein n=1 Tax=Trichinella papuae TaxID=268474 RepID=A0A0V1M0X2_9BILA|nr:hypothetical protein T10_12117 [Trichinella papuae]